MESKEEHIENYKSFLRFQGIDNEKIVFKHPKSEANNNLEITKKIFGLVNHLYELAEVSVEKRQAVNDEADKYVLNWILENIPNATKSEANDAVEFLEWTLSSGYCLNPHCEDSRWRTLEQIHSSKPMMSNGITTAELYEIFKSK